MWICLVHRKENKQQMDKFRTDLLKKGHNLALTCTDPFVGLNSDNQAFKSGSQENKKD